MMWRTYLFCDKVHVREWPTGALRVMPIPKNVCWNGLVHDQSLRLVVLYHKSWKRYFMNVRLAWGMVPIFHDLCNASGLAHIVRRTEHSVELDALILVTAVRGVIVTAKRTLVHTQLLARGMVPTYHYRAVIK